MREILHRVVLMTKLSYTGFELSDLNGNILNMLREMPIDDKNHVIAEVAMQIFRVVLQKKLRSVANSSQLPRSDRDLAFFLAFSGFYFDE